MTVLKDAAPANIPGGAAIMNMTYDGSNGWTCRGPGEAPMCADPGGHGVGSVQLTLDDVVTMTW